MKTREKLHEIGEGSKENLINETFFAYERIKNLESEILYLKRKIKELYEISNN